MTKSRLQKLEKNAQIQKERIGILRSIVQKNTSETPAKTNRKSEQQPILRLTKKNYLTYAEFAYTAGDYFNIQQNYKLGKIYFDLAEKYYKKAAETKRNSKCKGFWGKSGKLALCLKKHMNLFGSAFATLSACIEFSIFTISILRKDKKRTQS